MRYTAFLLPLLLLGCGNPPSSLVPLVGNQEPALPHSIEGVWRLASAKQKSKRRPIISFGSLADIVVTVSSETESRYHFSLQRENKDAVVSLTCKLSQIDDSFYIALQQPPISDPAIERTTLRPHFLAKLTFVDNHIRITGCDDEHFKDILEARQLPFVELDSSTVFTGTSEQLTRVIHEHSLELFRVGNEDVILARSTPGKSKNKPLQSDSAPACTPQ